MVGPFGGVTNAVLLNAALLHEDAFGDPIALTVNFAGPIADGDFDIEAKPTRSNRSTQHWSMVLTQGEEVQATATAVFAKRRETWSAVEASAPTDAPSPESLSRITRQGAPKWFANYDMRFIEGPLTLILDGQERAESVSRLWVRDEPPRPFSFTSLAAIADSFFPRVFLRRGKISPIGTVSMTTYFHAESAELEALGDRFLFATSRGLNFRNGYFDQTAEIWSDASELLASSYQIVYYRE